MALDIERPWFTYEDHGGQPRASVSVTDMDQDAGNISPVAGIVNRYIYTQWQSPTEDEWFQIDFGADVAIQSLTVVFPRITNPYRKYETQEILPTDLIRHYLDADGGTAGAGAVFDSGAVSCKAEATRGYSVTALSTEVTARYWRCQVNAASRASEGFFLVALGFAGPIFQPSFPHIYGDKLGFDDNSEIQRTPSSQTGFVTRNERTLKAVLVWDFIPDSERDAWDAMDEHAGKTEPIVYGRPNYDLAATSAVTGPDFYVLDGKKCFVGNNQSDLSLTSRQYDANIKQIQLTEHR